MNASGLPVGVTPVVDVLELARLSDEQLNALALPPLEPFESFAWKKTDIGPSVAAAVVASRQVLGGDVRALCGWSVAETTGAASAAIRFHDGSSATGEVFTRINLVANESNREYFTKDGVRCFTGRIYLEVISGSVEGVIYWR